MFEKAEKEDEHVSLEGELYELIEKRNRCINQDDGLSPEERSSALIDLNRRIGEINEEMRKLREKNSSS